MNQVIIYSPAKTSMQSGTAKTGYWVIEFKSNQAKSNDPLMGWIGGAQTQEQVNMKFPSKEAAIEYAEKNELSYTIRQPKQRGIILKAYSDNYAFSRREPWSH